MLDYIEREFALNHLFVPGLVEICFCYSWQNLSVFHVIYIEHLIQIEA